MSKNYMPPEQVKLFFMNSIGSLFLMTTWRATSQIMLINNSLIKSNLATYYVMLYDSQVDCELL